MTGNTINLRDQRILSTLRNDGWKVVNALIAQAERAEQLAQEMERHHQSGAVNSVVKQAQDNSAITNNGYKEMADGFAQQAHDARGLAQLISWWLKPDDEE